MTTLGTLWRLSDAADAPSAEGWSILLDDDADVVFRGDHYAFALFSKDEVYRYALGRSWNPKKKPLVVCMLNPSTADDRIVDPTVRKCIHFALRDGYGGLLVVNMFAFRATDPSALRAPADPVGPANDSILARLNPSNDVVAAWGAPKWPFVRARAEAVRKLRPSWSCFGHSKDGHPLHPCYLANKTPIAPWSPT